jgi:hypothetical protein
MNYVQEYRKDYTAVFWIEAGQRESLERDFLQIYSLLFGVNAQVRLENVKIEDAVVAV